MEEACEVCGKPARHQIQDLQVNTFIVDAEGLKWPNHEPHSTHHRCTEHNRIARLYVAEVMTKKE